ncbi:1-phosphofructokinase family hexose kinase [Lactobacillus crispatus]|jgi:tagatose-6-phosphate kinase|uniref:Tagatose-6-phosphate kinase n=1 Tax=Lactobacillus crispatus TaxID=47770 RepID=A0A135ZA09_9LACO|nr:hexose kinase [Lactobacillus crispatus]KXI18465.1 hexose kinase, 1-phosphofructokinase family [Lactobacillus crispatus]MCZ3785705.1 hexose kinase [Lactobacillus crispatus]MCZ3793313.1 hexose kinase [Lactobacillus crispatus]MDT9610258.1 hexose kinase [Lactobacillus crispatus]MDT9617859.1 hexose kinase [Lactobacillus crispatus]
MIITITANPSVDRLYQVNKLIPGALNRVEVKKHMVGGKGFNAGRVSSLLGRRTFVFGFIGGENGEFIKKEAQKDNYETWFIDTGKETRNCIQIIDQTSQKTEINENGLPIDEKYYKQLKNSLKGMLESRDIKAISLNGSLPEGCDYHYYLDLISLIRNVKPGCAILLDTSGNILNQVLDTDILPDIIKPNEHEIADYLGTDVTTDPKQLMENIENNPNLKKVYIIFVSLGSKGCLIKHGESYYYAVQKPVNAVNTEGSGDAMVGGILTAIDQETNNEKMIKYACAAGTANAMNIKTGYLDHSVFESLLPNITITPMN